MSEEEKTQRSRLPLHISISEMLAREIKAGVLLDGEKLPPERVMSARLGIAVGTLRKALDKLEEQGMLERVQGSGNYIKNVDSNNKTIYGFFRLELLSGGGLPSASTLSVQRVSAKRPITFSEQGEYDRIRRLRYLDNKLVALEEIWLDAAYSAKPIIVENLPDSLYHFYKEQLGFWIARVEDSIGLHKTPAWKPANVAKLFGPVAGFVERRSWDQTGKQAEYSRTWFNAETCRYVARSK